MDLLPFLLVVASAFSHASWNLLAKGSLGKLSFMWWIAFTSLFTVLPVFVVLLPDWSFPVEASPYLIASGVAEALYFFSLARAYELGDLSVVYPLARSSPLFIFILAVLFLGEGLSLLGMLGILLVVAGVYVIHLPGVSTSNLIKPLASLRGRASQFALSTAIWTTLYSLIDKLGVTVSNPISYAFWLDAFVVVFLTPVVFLRGGWRVIRSGWRENRAMRILASGFMMRLGYFLVLWAMALAQVSYIVAIRQLSVVIAVALGIVFLGEAHGRIRLLGSALVFTGVLILGSLT